MLLLNGHIQSTAAMTLLRNTALYFFLGALGLTAADKILTGTISDDMCGVDHSGMPHSGKVDAHKCALECAKADSKWVFISRGKIYTIANQSLPQLTTHAGHNVKVTGDLSSDGKTISIAKVEMLP
jgi:hypothetical protein